MKFSFNRKAEINQSINIVVASKDIEKLVSEKVKAAQKDIKLKGYRKGKAPMERVFDIYGPEIRQEVIFDLATKSFHKQAEEKDLKIVSRPNLIPEKIEEGKDVKFKATFEVYPEISLGGLSKLSYTNTNCKISEEDLDKTIVNLQKRMSKWEPSEEPSKEGDQVKINFIGKIDSEEFEGGSAKDFPVELGSNSMIEGFEEGLIGLKKGEERVLELDEEFFKGTGIEAKDVSEYRQQVLSRLEEDLENILKGKVRQSLYDALVEANEFDVPKAMTDSEITSMKQDTARRMGMDPKDMKEDLFPNETFEIEALKRVKIGMLLNKIIEDNQFKPDPDKVKEIIEERAKNYKEPQQVINYFYSDDEQLKNIESISLEEQVVDLLIASAKPVEEELTYEECISGNY